MTQKQEIGGLKIAPGTKQNSYLRVGPYFYHKRAYIRRYVLIPFTVIRGHEEGPTLAQVAGCHPTEYSGIDATIELTKAIEPEHIKGTLITVPCVNPLGFKERSYITPIDGKNIQGLYPGISNGTISDMTAFRLFHDIILKSDHFLDCHGSDIHESNIWSFIYYGTEDETEKKSEAISRATGLTYLSRSVYPGSMGMEAAIRGVSGGLYELCSGDKLITKESMAIFNGTQNVMKHLGMLEGEPIEIKTPTTVDGQKQELWTSGASAYFTKAGLFHNEIIPGQMLKKGEFVGTVTNFWGEVVETITAPADGRVSGTIHNPVANPGDTAIAVHF